MRELSLFTGAGGGLLGTKLLGWETIGYVEIDQYCQQVIAQRIKDGILDRAPLFGDIRTFLSEGYARRYRGVADVITAGFPCQPFSQGGKKKGSYDERNFWPETRSCIDVVRPNWAFLENVPGLLAHEYARTIFGELAELRYDARWCVLSAKRMGANHLRRRLWIAATTTDAFSCGPQRRWQPISRQGMFLEFEGLVEDESRLCVPCIKANGVYDGLANRMDRLKALGNGQVPIVAATAWRLLTEGKNE